MHDLTTALRLLSRSTLLRRIALPAALATALTAGCGGTSDTPMTSLGDGGVAGDAQVAMSDDGGGAAPDAGPVILDVAGRVVDPDGAPLAGRIVRVDGRTTTTDAEGRFAFDDVPAPYDALVTTVGSSQVRIAAGLRTATPVILHGWRDVLRETTLAGTITGLPAPSAEHDDLFGVRSDYNGETFSRNAYNSFGSLTARWYGPATAMQHVMFVRATITPDRMPVEYHALGAASIEATGGMPASGMVIAAVNPAETTMRATATWPEDATGHNYAVHVSASGASVHVADVDDDALEVVMPSGAGVTAGITATAWTPGGVGLRFVQGMPANATDVVLDVPGAPRVVSPEPGATGVAPGDVISWTWDGGEAFYVVQLGVSDGELGYAPYVDVRTTETSVVIPDLSDLGIEWPADRSMSVWIYAIGVERTPEEVPSFDLDAFVGTVWGSDGMATEDGALGFIRDGVHFTTGS